MRWDIDIMIIELKSEICEIKSKYLRFIEQERKLKSEYEESILEKLHIDTIRNDEYNSLIENGYNQGKIKAMLHNQVIHNLREKLNKVSEDASKMIVTVWGVGYKFKVEEQ